MRLPAPYDIFIERGVTFGPLVITVYDDLPPLDTPTAPTITVFGTGGAATWTYKIVARNSNPVSPNYTRFSAVSGSGATIIGNATLTSTNYNRISFAAVTDANIYDIYRIVSGGTPATLGLIGSTGGTFFNDTGVAGDGTTAPSVGGPGVVVDLTGYTPHAQARRIPDDTLLKDLNPSVTDAAGGEVTIPKFDQDATLLFKPCTDGKWSLVLENTGGDWQPPIVAGAYSASFSVTRDQP